jgi:RES domain-containing protein
MRLRKEESSGGAIEGHPMKAKAAPWILMSGKTDIALRMRCCADCFESPTIRQKITAQGAAGKCDLCGEPDRATLDVRALSPEFGVLVSHYYPGSIRSLGITVTGPGIRDLTLCERIAGDKLLVFAEKVPWEVRNPFLDAVRGEDVSAAMPSSGPWLSNLIGVWSILATAGAYGTWGVFKKAVQSERRYAIPFGSGPYPDFPAMFRSDAPAFSKKLSPGDTFYRARVKDPAMGESVTRQQMGAPTSDNATPGRANASGIAMLYVAESETTAIAEIRSFLGAIVHVARCTVVRPAKVFDLTEAAGVHGMDPFAADFEARLDTAQMMDILDREFAEPIAPHTPHRDYAPTQYIAELIADAGYDGIRYKSAMDPNGRNVVFFAPDIIEVSPTNAVQITAINVTHQPYLSMTERIMQMAAKASLPDPNANG